MPAQVIQRTDGEGVWPALCSTHQIDRPSGGPLLAPPFGQDGSLCGASVWVVSMQCYTTARYLIKSLFALKKWPDILTL